MAKDEKKPRKELTKKSKTTNRQMKNLRHNPEDNIAKSKKLVEKIQKRKSSVNSSRSVIRSKDHRRVCPNGKPMPPLSELERMYEDSDDDNSSKTVPTQTSKSSTNSCQKISTDKLTSPKTIQIIADKMMDLISNLPDPTSIIENGAPPSPPKKRKKSECENHPQALKTSSSMFCNGDDIDKSSEDEDECPQKRAKILKNDNITTWLKDCVKGDNSDDSNKTVDYDYTSNIGRPQPFSPLPSTSKDKETINKNDQLFNESLNSETYTSNNQSKTNIFNETNIDSNTEVKPNVIKDKEKLETGINTMNTSNMDDVELVERPCETIVIDDEIETERPITTKYSHIKSDIIECIDIDETIIKKEHTNVAEYSEPIVIDDEDGEKYINDSQTLDENTEVIDIDNIIAENQAIIEKYSKKRERDIHTVTCVDTTTISNLNTANSAEPSNSADAPKTTNKNRRENNISNSGECVNIQKNKSNNIKNIVTNYFSNNSDSQNLPREKVPKNVAGTSLWNKVTEWLDNLTPNYATNTRMTSRNRSQPDDPTNDSVIIIDDVPSPLNNPRKPPEVPTLTHTLTNNSTDKVMRINGVVQSYTNSVENPKVDIGSSDYIDVYCSGDDWFLTDSEGPLPGFDSSNLIHKRIPVRKFLDKQASLQSLVAAKSPSKTKSPNSSKNFGDCPICMDSLANNSVASTICGHVFCMKCIEAAFKASGKRCPTCRKVLKKGGYHQIFL